MGGETFATATVISSLPFFDTGNTCAAINDYTPTCALSQAGDLVYRYTPSTNVNICLSLCGSDFDTILYVYGPGGEIACNDDDCGLQSQLDNVPLTAGYTYYFVVDGYSMNCGNYTFNTCFPPPPFFCPPDSQIEGEPRCGPDYVDNYNGGCGSNPIIFTDVACGSICGEMGTFMFEGMNYRDTDWYRLTVGPGAFTYNGSGEIPPLRRFVLTPECPPAILATTNIDHSPLPFTGPGSFYFFASSDVFTGIPCGTRYAITFEGPGIPPCGSTAVESRTWGGIKSAYR